MVYYISCIYPVFRFPKAFVSETVTSDNGYPSYRRRRPVEGGNQTETIHMSRSTVVDNRWIVPYSPILCKIFKAHINVEYCNSVKAIQYICKYINKGTDKTMFNVVNKGDEINRYRIGRYVNTNEAVWKILGFPIHERYPNVVQLTVHLENGQRVYFRPENVHNRLEVLKRTTLTAFFELCKSDNFAKTLFYHRVPTYYVWDVSSRSFKRRKIGKPVEGYQGIKSSETLSRVYTIHPKNMECYYVRLLLHNIKGPTCFQDLRTINGQILPDYFSACKMLGLLEDDSHWGQTLEEASACVSSSQLRSLFAVMLSICEIKEVNQLWDNHKNALSQDILYQYQKVNTDTQFNEQIYNEALILIEDQVLKINDLGLDFYKLPKPQRTHTILNMPNEYIYELSYDTAELQNVVELSETQLYPEQNDVYSTILGAVQCEKGGLFFIDAPGGTGKTFLLQLLLSKIRASKRIAIAVASSGIAATLLPGGRTAHSTFKLPFNLNTTEYPVCHISKKSARAKILQECSVIVWDECTMAHRKAIEALDRTMQDLKNNKNLMGGTVVVFSGLKLF